MKNLALLALLGLCAFAAHAEETFRIDRSVVLTSDGEYHWSQSRAVLIPGDPARVIGNPSK